MKNRPDIVSSKTGVIVVAFLLFCVSSAHAQWKQIENFTGGSANELVEIDSVLFVRGSLYSGIYRSYDEGETWEECSQELPVSYSEGQGLLLLAAHGNRLYVSVWNKGLYYSDDQGNSWNYMATGGDVDYIIALAFKENEIFVSDRNGKVLHSSNLGIDWVEIQSLPERFIADFTFHEDKLFGISNRLYEYQPTTQSWKEIIVEGFGEFGHVATIESFKGELLIAQASQIYRSKDLITWNLEKFNTGGSIVNIKATPDRVFFTTAHGVFYMSENPDTGWIKIRNGLSGKRFVRDLAFSGSSIIESTDNGIFVSHDQGTSWAEANQGYITHSVVELYSNDKQLFINTSNEQVFRGGEINTNNFAWERIENGLDAGFAKFGVKFHKVGETLFLASPDALYFSEDNGESWQLNFDPGVSYGYTSIASSGGVLATTAPGEGVYLSFDTAKTWIRTEPHSTELNSSYPHLAISGDSLVLGDDRGNIFTSTDLGQSWLEKSTSESLKALRKIVLYQNMLFAATKDGLFYSTDFGGSWVLYNNFNRSTYDIQIINNILLLGTTNGLYYSHVDDDKWYKLEGLSNNTMFRVSLHKDLLLAGTVGSGLWFTSKKEINIPPVITGSVRELSINEDDSLSIQLKDFKINDPDHNMEELTLFLDPGSNYDVFKQTIIPDSNFVGVLAVNLYVSDGIDTSEVYQLPIEILPVNDAPVITGTAEPMGTALNYPIEVGFEDLLVEDPDNEYPKGFTLTVLPGEYYTVENNVVTPDKEFEGFLTVPVEVSDGEYFSEVYELSIEVSSAITGINLEEISAYFRLYPNPTKQNITVEFENQEFGVVRLQLLNSRGQEVWVSTIEKLEPNFSLLVPANNYTPGIYLLRVVQGTDRIVTKRVFIK